MAAMLVYQNRGTVAILVNQANPLGTELYFYADTFFLFHETNVATGHVSENALYSSNQQSLV